MTTELHAHLLPARGGSPSPFLLVLTCTPEVFHDTIVAQIPVDSVGQGRRIAAQRGATFNF